jgi:tetratricopeptide (TPR) repeat protein
MSRFFNLAWLFAGSCMIAAAQQPQLSDLGAQPVSHESRELAGVRQAIDARQFAQAEDILRGYLQANDLSSDAHTLLAYALLRENKPRESLAEYTRAASLSRPTADTLINVAQDYVLLDDLDDAVAWNLRAVQMEPHNAEAWYGLGRLRYSQQRYGDAKSAFGRALELAPESVKVENNLGLALEATDDLDGAGAAYRKAIAMQASMPLGERSDQPLLNLATLLLHENKATEAEPLLRQAVEIDPSEYRSREQLGHLYFQRSEFALAQDQLEQAVKLAPDQSSLRFLLGQAYQKQGKKQQATQEFAAAQRLTSAAAMSKP